MSITKIKPSLLRSVISFMREICMCHCEKRIFFSLEMNRNSLHLHSGGPMRHIRSHLSKLQWLRSSHCFANAKQSCSTLFIISSDSEFPSTRCVNHCSFQLFSCCHAPQLQLSHRKICFVFVIQGRISTVSYPSGRYP